MADPDLVDRYAKTAHQLVDFVIENAIKRLSEENVDRAQTIESIRFDLSRDSTYVYDPPQYENYDCANITWLSIQEFSVEKAESKINEFIKTWDFQGSWLHCIDYLGSDDSEFDVRYRFRVRWSIPTRRKPVPRATASVYFTFDVSKIKPANFPVDVYYVFETNRLVHRPGQSRFREKWLKDIIENKVIMMAAIDF